MNYIIRHTATDGSMTEKLLDHCKDAVEAVDVFKARWPEIPTWKIEEVFPADDYAPVSQ